MSEDITSIQFVDDNGDDLFTLPDNGYLCVTFPDGEIISVNCKYIDEKRTLIDYDRVYHNDAFAKEMESVGAVFVPELQPEIVQGYRIVHRIPVRNKVFVMAVNQDAVQPYVTWQGYKNKPGYEIGHYFSSGDIARKDLRRRADWERKNVPFDSLRKKVKPYNLER